MSLSWNKSNMRNPYIFIIYTPSISITTIEPVQTSIHSFMAATSFLLSSALRITLLLPFLFNHVQSVPMISTFLNPHNQIRAKYGLRPLQWSYSLANYAEWYANERRNDCQLIHSNSNYGENIFWGKGTRWKPVDAVREWVAENSYYNYKTNRCNPAPGKECLHYTQLVWRSTTKVGCAQITCKTGDTFITCNYDPHGNVIGQKPY